MAGRTRADLLRDRFGVDVGVNLDPVVASVGTTATQILRKNPNRLAFTVINLSAAVVYIKPENTVSTASGIVLAAGGGSVNLVWDEDYDAVGMDWYAVASAGASAILTIEVVAR
jgi:hypothetical protein